MASQHGQRASGRDAAAGRSEAVIQSFVVTITVEEAGDNSDDPSWHGRINHQPSGRRRYFRDLDAIADFIAPFLAAMGIRTGIGSRVRRWLKRRP